MYVKTVSVLANFSNVAHLVCPYKGADAKAAMGDSCMRDVVEPEGSEEAQIAIIIKDAVGPMSSKTKNSSGSKASGTKAHSKAQSSIFVTRSNSVSSNQVIPPPSSSVTGRHSVPSNEVILPFQLRIAV